MVRAGGGSARDTLSVLDQLMGGAGSEGVTYDLAIGLLGFTPDTLLDEVVDAFAAGDGATVFGVVDKVIETGQDPRRFTEDLLRRLRDLVIISAVPDAPATGLIDVPQDQGERLTAQAARFGRADLSRSAELVADGLTELKGATAPRLLLELICARVLLPGADHGTEGIMARLDRIEKRMCHRGHAERRRAARGRPVATGADAHARRRARSRRPADARAEPTPEPLRPSRPRPEPAAEPTPSAPSAPEQEAEPAPAAAAAPEPGTGTSTGLSLVDVRRLWPDLLDAVKLKRRYTWILLSQNAQVAAVDDKTLTIALLNAGARNSFSSGGSEEILRQAAIDVIGHDWRIEAIVDPSAQPGAESPIAVTRPAVPEQSAGDPSRRAAAQPAQPAPRRSPRRRPGGPSTPSRWRPRGARSRTPGLRVSRGSGARTCPTRTRTATTPTPTTTPSAVRSSSNASSVRASSKRSSTTERTTDRERRDD